MMESAPPVFVVGFDEETLWEDVNCSQDDYLSFEEILETVNKGTNDSGEIIVLDEYNPKSQSFKAADIEDDDDDDCVVLDGDPDKVSRVGEEIIQCDADNDELIVIRQKGQIACRDYPHARFLCAKFPFSSTPHESFCDQCHCFVCDSPAPCAHWSKGVSSDNHCHATDEGEFWKAERKSCKLKKDHVPAVPGLHDSPLSPSLPHVECVPPLDIIRFAQNSIPQGDVSRQTLVRPCSFMEKFSVPRSQKRGNFWCRNGNLSLPAAKHVFGVRNSAIWRGRSSSIGNSATHAFSLNTMFKRAGVVGGPICQFRGPSSNIKSGHASLYTRTRPLATSNEKNPYEWQNSYPNMNLGSYGCYSSTQLTAENVSEDVVLSQPQVSCPATSQPNEDQNILGNQSQNPTNPGTLNLGFEWANSTSESNLQPPVANSEFYNTGSADGDLGARHVNQFCSHLTRSVELNYDCHYYGSLFCENQSPPEVPGSCAPCDMDDFSPECTGVDAGMLLFDFETSCDGLTRV